MKRKKNKGKDYWDSLATDDENAPVIDPNDTIGKKNRYIVQIRNKVFIEFLQAFNSDIKVLDFGCGTGTVTRLINNLGYNCIGIDISANLIIKAKKLSETCIYVLFDGVNVPLRSNYFDLSLTYVVFSYITNDKTLLVTLQHLVNSLKPGARLLFIEQTSSRNREVEQGLKKIRTIESYKKIFSEAGLDCKKIKKIRTGHFPLLYLIRYGVLPTSSFRFIGMMEKLYISVSIFFPNEYFETAFYLEKN